MKETPKMTVAEKIENEKLKKLLAQLEENNQRFEKEARARTFTAEQMLRFYDL